MSWVNALFFPFALSFWTFSLSFLGLLLFSRSFSLLLIFALSFPFIEYLYRFGDTENIASIKSESHDAYVSLEYSFTS